MAETNAHGAICGGSYLWLGPPPPKRPRCAGPPGAKHRERFMRYRPGSETWICGRCGFVMTHEQNMARPENVKKEYEILASLAHEALANAVYDYGRREPHHRVCGWMEMARDWQGQADEFYREHADTLAEQPKFVNIDDSDILNLPA